MTLQCPVSYTLIPRPSPAATYVKLKLDPLFDDVYISMRYVYNTPPYKFNLVGCLIVLPLLETFA